MKKTRARRAKLLLLNMQICDVPVLVAYCGFRSLLFRRTGILLAIHKVRKKSGTFHGKGRVFICLNWQDHVKLFGLYNGFR